MNVRRAILVAVSACLFAAAAWAETPPPRAPQVKPSMDADQVVNSKVGERLAKLEQNSAAMAQEIAALKAERDALAAKVKRLEDAAASEEEVRKQIAGITEQRNPNLALGYILVNYVRSHALAKDTFAHHVHSPGTIGFVGRPQCGGSMCSPPPPNRCLGGITYECICPSGATSTRPCQNGTLGACACDGR